MNQNKPLVERVPEWRHHNGYTEWMHVDRL